jgi:hypothetical protein
MPGRVRAVASVELAGLRRSRVDLLRRTVEVAEIVTEVGGVLGFGPPKTRAGPRTVGLPRDRSRPQRGPATG